MLAWKRVQHSVAGQRKVDTASAWCEKLIAERVIYSAEESVWMQRVGSGRVENTSLRWLCATDTIALKRRMHVFFVVLCGLVRHYLPL